MNSKINAESEPLKYLLTISRPTFTFPVRISLLLPVLVICSLCSSTANAQPLPVNEVREIQYRTLQLLSDSTVATSMTNRAIWNQTYRSIFDDKKVAQYNHAWWARPLGSEPRELWRGWHLSFYEPVLTNTLNSRLPHGGNNGAAWYGRGLTTELQGGAAVTSRFFTATVRPHISYTQNSDFRAPRFIPVDIEGNPQYTAIFSGIDMPFRFGPGAYTDFDWGQTSLRLHYKSIEAGLSNEPLWWGPGIQNALMLSNNAAGLQHAFFGTRYPLELPLGIGDLQFKLIWGRPHDSDYFRATPQTDRRRFTTGINMSYSPGFAPNLNIGLIRFSHRYVPENGLTLSDLGAVIPYYGRRQIGGSDAQNQLASAYFRWVFPESGAEVYGEYMREDSFWDARDLFMEPDHDRAFTVGFQKLVETSGWFDLVKINGEINSLVPNRTDDVRPQTYYYRHSRIEQGHTNRGQVLGASVGPGSASQYLGANGYFDKGNIGLFIQRVADNDFFHYEYYDHYFFYQEPWDLAGANATKDIYHHRINLNIGLHGRYKIGPWLLGGRLVWNKNYNYGRFNYGDFEDATFGSAGKNDLVNLQFQLSVRYFFGSTLFN